MTNSKTSSVFKKKRKKKVEKFKENIKKDKNYNSNM